MEGKKMFNYDSVDKNNSSRNKKDVQEIVANVLQVLLGIIMAIFHA